MDIGINFQMLQAMVQLQSIDLTMVWLDVEFFFHFEQVLIHDTQIGLIFYEFFLRLVLRFSPLFWSPFWFFLCIWTPIFSKYPHISIEGHHEEVYIRVDIWDLLFQSCKTHLYRITRLIYNSLAMIMVLQFSTQRSRSLQSPQIPRKPAPIENFCKFSWIFH